MKEKNKIWKVEAITTPDYNNKYSKFTIITKSKGFTAEELIMIEVLNINSTFKRWVCLANSLEIDYKDLEKLILETAREQIRLMNFNRGVKNE